MDYEELVTAWENHRREVASAIAATEGLDADAQVELVREALESQPGAKVVLQTLKANGWRGPAFDTYRTRTLLDQFGDRAPASALDLEAFREDQRHRPRIHPQG